jgi:hypothetical protein
MSGSDPTGEDPKARAAAFMTVNRCGHDPAAETDKPGQVTASYPLEPDL